MMIFTKKPEVLTISGGNKGFTLSEVLLTLGIIGVVAAMTIPTLIENNQKAQYVTALKKVYSNFNQVLVQYSADNGCVGDLRCTGLFYVGNTQENVGDALAPYFNIAQNCKMEAGCFSGKVSENFDGSGERSDFIKQSPSFYNFTTTDGANYSLVSAETNCSDDGFSSGATVDLSQYCGYIEVDVNGDKGPNNYGRDIFQFYITNGRGPKLYPAGGKDSFYSSWDSDPSALGCSPYDTYGFRCAGRVIEEGWQMNY